MSLGGLSHLRATCLALRDRYSDLLATAPVDPVHERLVAERMARARAFARARAAAGSPPDQLRLDLTTDEGSSS